MQFNPKVEQFRYKNRGRYSEDDPLASNTGDDYGLFIIPGPCSRPLKVVVSAGDDEVFWEHISVSGYKHIPNWQEMCFIKDLFWAPEEVVMQLHPAKSNYVNIHENVLHLWRPTKETIPLPPVSAV